MPKALVSKTLKILVWTLFAAVGVAFFGGFGLSVALHYVDHGVFGFTWFFPILFSGAAVVAFAVYFLQFFLKRKFRS